MKFGDTPIGESEGAILAHSVRLGKKVFKKGRVLGTDDIAVLRAAGIESVVAARLDAGDVGEDEAAARIAEAVHGENVSASAAFTGRCNLFARSLGLVVYDPLALEALNRVDEALTIAAVPPFDVVEPRRMVATIKVIPFAVPEYSLAAFEAAAGKGGPLLRIAPFAVTDAGLVQSLLPGTKDSLLDKTRTSVGGRLERLGSRLTAERRCTHDSGAIADLRQRAVI